MEERLQKFMAKCGVASRRNCEELIKNGLVSVNGSTVTELGIKVNGEKDIVLVNNVKIELEEKKVYIALNKPEGYVSTVKDEKNRSTILDLIDVDERIYPIGRLDYDTSGIILLTNDGDVYNNIIHPRQEVNKIYRAVLDGKPTEEEIYKFCKGLNIDGYITAPAKFKVLISNNKTSKVEIAIHEGKNRQVRKMCAAINHEVISLKRIIIGKIKLGGLKEGTWRYLDDEEVNYLKSL